MSDTQELYTPEEDITKKLADGREVLVAAKGIPMLRNKAVTLGLIKQPQAQGPSEIKAEGEGGELESEGAPITPPVTDVPVVPAEGASGDQGELTVDPASEIPGTLETTEPEPVRKKKA